MSNININIEEIKKLLNKYNYYATDELVYNTFLGLYQLSKGKINVGQDIFATCLEGPPGAGKTYYAETYTKLINDIYGDCEFVEYQCNATTGKEDLYEDIDIIATVSRDTANIRIAGKVTQAIKLVNEGKKVVLFIDEYDKAREETDAFLLDFLQSGKINTNQHGDMSIKEEYKNNLQVILCKNDFRESLSGPLSRRIRIIRLDYMTPEVFNNLARTRLIDNKEVNEKVEEGLINLVSLMYQEAYDNKDIYLKLPSASELLIAIQDADVLTKYANAPKSIIYDTIIRGMFKMEDDIKTFESNVKNNNSLKNVIESMLDEKINDEEISLNDIIIDSYFPDKKQQLDEYMNEIIEALDEVEKLRNINQEEEQEEDNNASINLNNAKYLKEDIPYKPISNFNDGTEYIRRGEDIFTSSNKEWTEVANIILPTNQANLYFTNLLTEAYNSSIIAYENGYLISDTEKGKIILIRENNQNNTKLTIFNDNKIITKVNLLKILNTIVKASTIIPINSNDYNVEVNTLLAGVQTGIDEQYKVDGFDNLYLYNFETNNIEELKEELERILNIESNIFKEELEEITKQLENKIKIKKKTK